MGVISTFINGLDPSNQTDAEIKELLSVVSKLADAKMTEFQSGMDDSWIKGDQDSLAPGVTKDFEDSVTHVIVGTNYSPVIQAIGSIVDGAFKLGTDPNAASVSTFIKTLASNGFNVLMGSGGADEGTHKQYIIYPDNNFICRCDIWMWRYTIQSSGFRTKVSSVVAYRMQYGAVDITKVNKIALARWFSRWHLDPATATAMLQQMNSLIDAAKPPSNGEAHLSSLVASINGRKQLIDARMAS